MKYKISNTTIILKIADITEEDSDAIVNAANSHLAHGGGVAGAIVRKGGNIIQEESDRIGFVPVGKAAITSAGALKAKYVIHAVGPRMGEGDEDAKLRSATLSPLELAITKGLHTISFPAISTGIFGYPVERCAPIMLQTVRDFCKQETSLNEIRFCLFDDSTVQTFTRAAETLL
jgi:O-acetyl-ADP-ribose deacetylase (regulator of RNase III)